MRSAIILKLPLQPLSRRPKHALSIYKRRLIARTQEEDSRVPGAGYPATIPRYDAVQTRLQLELGDELQRVTDVDDSAVGARCNEFPVLCFRRKDLQAPVGVEQNGNAPGVGVRKVSRAGV